MAIVDSLPVGKIVSLRSFCDACLQSTFNRKSGQIVGAAPLTVISQDASLTKTLARQCLEIGAIHLNDLSEIGANTSASYARTSRRTSAASSGDVGFR